MNSYNQRLTALYESSAPDAGEIVHFLSTADPEEERALYAFADDVRKARVGDGILLRGIVEFSNYCKNRCAYCGLNAGNVKIARYRIGRDELLRGIEHLVSCTIATVVLQSGEDEGIEPQWIADVVREIKSRWGVAVTLSVGEQSRDVYALWKEAGADRYLLKIETSDRNIYEPLHPEMSFDNRLRCLDDLRSLRYQVGSGIIVGLRGQTVESIAQDILFFRKNDFDMLGIGPFIPHGQSPLANDPAGNAQRTLRTIALTRILNPDAHLPATTALGSLGGQDLRTEGIKAGANVLMPNFTPRPYRSLYEIYPGKRCVEEQPGACAFCMDSMARSLGRRVDLSRGDSLKGKSNDAENS